MSEVRLTLPSRPAMGARPPGEGQVLFPIGLRLVLGTVALVAGVLAVVVTSWIASEQALVRSLRRNEAESFAVAMSGAWANELIDENWNQIRNQLFEVTRQSEDFAYVMITDERRGGRVIAAVPEELMGTYVPDVVPVEVTRVALSETVDARLSETFLLRDIEIRGVPRALRGERIVEVAADIEFQEHRVGVLRVGVSLRAVEEARQRALEEALVFGGISLLVGILGAFFLARQITGPIRALEASAARMAGGDFAHRSVIKTRDEIGSLSATFNHMAGELKATFDRLRGTLTSFERFVPRKFLRVVAPEGIEKIQVGTRATRTITILFSDIRGYTSISEQSTAVQMFELLNDYLGEMGAAIDAEGGFIDKYIGDAIMALFDEDDADGAVRAAIGMRERLAAWNARRKAAGLTEIDIGIGLHRGEVVMGTVGYMARIDSTVIGDAVNLASRIEGLTKNYHVAILISDAVLEAIARPEQFVVRTIDRAAKVKGKDEAVVLHTVDGWAPGVRKTEPASDASEAE